MNSYARPIHSAAGAPDVLRERIKPSQFLGGVKLRLKKTGHIESVSNPQGMARLVPSQNVDFRSNSKKGT